jgi:succinate-semialdehyde dehydrogenase/glutarate-semialdehyde dehydrogenase
VPARPACGANRLFAQDKIYDAFVARLSEAVRALKISDGFEAAVASEPPVIAVFRRHRALDRGIDIRVVEHDEGRIAAEFHRARFTVDALCAISFLPISVDP